MDLPVTNGQVPLSSGFAFLQKNEQRIKWQVGKNADLVKHRKYIHTKTHIYCLAIGYLTFTTGYSINFYTILLLKNMNMWNLSKPWSLLALTIKNWPMDVPTVRWSYCWPVVSTCYQLTLRIFYRHQVWTSNMGHQMEDIVTYHQTNIIYHQSSASTINVLSIWMAVYFSWLLMIISFFCLLATDSLVLLMFIFHTFIIIVVGETSKASSNLSRTIQIRTYPTVEQWLPGLSWHHEHLNGNHWFSHNMIFAKNKVTLMGFLNG